MAFFLVVFLFLSAATVGYGSFILLTVSIASVLCIVVTIYMHNRQYQHTADHISPYSGRELKTVQ